MAIPIMVTGTSSGAGKTLVCACLCNILSKMGYSVAPFKMQNMSLNSIVSPLGGEMSIAQYIQAVACKKTPCVKYNPILLKPQDHMTYVVFNGEYYAKYSPQEYMKSRKSEFFEKGIEILKELMQQNDYVIIEGAGSPVEVNLMKYDITNMAVAKAVKAHTIIVADIERGGSFAGIVGTMEIFNKEERALVKGFIFNKYYGDKSMLKDGIDYLYDRYKIKTVGIIPYKKHSIPEEDSLVSWESKTGELDIRIVRYPHISNFSDFEPLQKKNGVRYISTAQEVSGDLIILPGSKSTVSDLLWLNETGISQKIKQAAENKSFILGICGGFQMLTRSIDDSFESKSNIAGLGLIPLKTHFEERKITESVKGKVFFKGRNFFISGYELRHGRTECAENWLIDFDSHKDGFFKDNIMGTYLHGLFYNHDFTNFFLNYLRRSKGYEEKDFGTYSLYDEISSFSDYVSEHIDMKEILQWH